MLNKNSNFENEEKEEEKENQNQKKNDESKGKDESKGNDEAKENEITNKENINSKKKFVIRPGDWICLYCNNVNFSFRNACNRCRLSKHYWYDFFFYFSRILSN